MHLPRSVEVVEVGPRDGLQNESVMVSTEDSTTVPHNGIKQRTETKPQMAARPA